METKVSILEEKKQFVEQLKEHNNSLVIMLSAFSLFKDRYGSDMTVESAIDILDNEILNLFADSLLEEVHG